MHVRTYHYYYNGGLDCWGCKITNKTLTPTVYVCMYSVHIHVHIIYIHTCIYIHVCVCDTLCIHLPSVWLEAGQRGILEYMAWYIPHQIEWSSYDTDTHTSHISHITHQTHHTSHTSHTTHIHIHITHHTHNTYHTSHITKSSSSLQTCHPHREKEGQE